MMACYFSKVPRWIKFHCSIRHCKKSVYLRIQGREDVSYWFAHFESRNSSIMDPRSIKMESGPDELIFFSSNPPPIFYMLFKRRKSIGKENSFDTWNFRFYRLLVQSSRVFSCERFISLSIKVNMRSEFARIDFYAKDVIKSCEMLLNYWTFLYAHVIDILNMSFAVTYMEQYEYNFCTIDSLLRV